MQTTGQLQSWAARRGLVLGIAPAGPFERGEAALKWRAERGLTTPFTSGSLEEHCRPGVLYPEARSLVVVASPHPEPAGPSAPGMARVARYALGPDYHSELQGHLQDLAGVLRQAGAYLAAVQVDSGPLLEREAAYLAGLGYYGASCNLIIPGLGTGASLGLVITDLELEPGRPLKPATCKGCGRCLAACPTGALIAPGRLHPERCLSYLTQKRGIIPEELRPLFGQYIWGCDACQEVCPANLREKVRAGRDAIKDVRGEDAQEKGAIHRHKNLPGEKSTWSKGRRGEEAAWCEEPQGKNFTRCQQLQAGKAGSPGVNPALALPDLVPILTMNSEEFKRAFSSTAMAWRGKTVLQRNAAIALGNLAGAGTIPLTEPATRGAAVAMSREVGRVVASLEQALYAPSAILRGHVAWALGRLGPAGRPALEKARGRETDPWVRQEIEAALGLT